jgi:hypothetical protein
LLLRSLGVILLSGSVSCSFDVHLLVLLQNRAELHCVAGLPAISAFESQKSRASGISLASLDVISLDTVTGIHGFGLSGIVANLAIRLLRRIVS